jgi:hypothetical protein
VRIVLLASAAFALLLSSVPSAGAADECRGLLVCIPVAGPWVAVPEPTASDQYPSRSWRLRCPPGSIVGGVDARLTDRAVDVAFTGLLGSPVNPGITTTNEVVVSGTFTGRARRPSAFRPFIGCIPTAGGGRIPTAAGVPQAVKPGQPTVLRVRTVPVLQGTPAAATQACAAGERLVSASQAVGLRTGRQPTVAQLAGVRSSLVRRGIRVVAVARLSGAARSVQARLQVIAVCAKGPGQP